MNKEDFYDYNQVFGFLTEFLPAIEKEGFDFDEFMKYMYGGVEEFKKYNLKDINEDYKKLCEYLEKYKKIVKEVKE